MNHLKHTYIILIVSILIMINPISVSSQSDIDSLLQELEKKYETDLLYHIAQYYFPDSLEKSSYYAYKALEEARSNDNIDAELKTLILHGHIASIRFESSKALEFYIEALENSGKTEDFGILTKINYSIGRVYSSWDKFNKAIPFLIKGLIYAKKDSSYSDHAIINNQLAECYLYLGKPDSAEYCLTNAYNYFINSGDTIKAAGVLVNYATLLHELESYNEAITFELKALELFSHITSTREGDFLESKVSLMVNIGYTYRELGDYNKAQEYSQAGLQLALEHHMLEWQMLSYENISLIYGKLEQFDKAFEYHQKFSQIKDSVFTKEKHKQISEIETKYNTKQNEQRIQLLEKESHLQKILIFAGSMLTLTVLIILILLRSRYILKLKVHQKEKNELDLQMNQRNRELISASILLSEKIKILQSIKDLISKITLPDNDPQNKYLIDVNSYIWQSIHTSDNWEKIKKHFAEVHPNFMDNLLVQFPHLSQSELKHCTYIKLNLSTNEIAQLLNISNKSVQTARYRLKKKMNLIKEDDLVNIIMNL
ncbi:tetratricopeptide repeat protein [Bacteroidota bacterium]